MEKITCTQRKTGLQTDLKIFFHKTTLQDKIFGYATDVGSLLIRCNTKNHRDNNVAKSPNMSGMLRVENKNTKITIKTFSY